MKKSELAAILEKEKNNQEFCQRVKGEHEQASKLVAFLLSEDEVRKIHINNGEDIEAFTDASKAADYLWQTDEETVVAYGHDGARLGAFYLVYGNSPDELISDYSDNEFCESADQKLRLEK